MRGVTLDADVVAISGIIETKVPLPVEPLYDVAFAAQLIPCQPSSLKSHMNKRKAMYPPRYRQDGSRRRHRLVTAAEIRSVRMAMLKGDIASTLSPAT